MLASLGEHELPAAHLALLTPTTLQGQRQTKRQKLKHGLALQRLGQAVPADARLHVERPAAGAASLHWHAA